MSSTKVLTSSWFATFLPHQHCVPSRFIKMLALLYIMIMVLLIAEFAQLHPVNPNVTVPTPAPTLSTVDTDHFEARQDDDEEPRNCPFSIPTFPCSSLTPQPTPLASSLFRSIPISNISLASSLGDSITTGLFMRGSRGTLTRYLLDMSVEDRGYTFAIGGKKEAVSLGNFVESMGQAENRGGLKGLAFDRTQAFEEPEDIDDDELNLGLTASSADELDRQVTELVRRLSSDEEFKRLNGEGQWKWIHVFSGGNDLCHSCEEDYTTKSPFAENEEISRADPEYYAHVMNKTIQQLYDSLPQTSTGQRNAFLSLYTFPYRLSEIYWAGRGDSWCRNIQRVGEFCPCLYESDETRSRMDKLTDLYNRQLAMLARSWQQQNHPDFYVSLVRSQEGLDLKQMGERFISRTDCFHPNECYHQLVAWKVWQDVTGGQPVTQVTPESFGDWFQPSGENDELTWRGCETYHSLYELF